MQVEITARPAVPSETQIPQAVEDALTSRGMRASWQKNSREMLSSYHGLGMRAVTKKVLEEMQIPEDVMGVLYFTPEGFLQKWDCYLFMQPLAIYEQRRAQVAALTRMREGKSAVVDQAQADLEQLLSEVGVPASALQKGGGKIFENVRDAREHVEVSRERRD